jgi:hypothetical protein
LRQRHSLNCLPHHVESFVTHGTRKTHSVPGKTEEIYPKAYWPGDSDFAHLEFALKREGLHLQLLRALLPRLSAEQLTAYIKSKPTSAYARRIWFLYEKFSGQKLDLQDLKQGNYENLLDARIYYTGPIARITRQRINFNLPGTLAFSPMVRRTKMLKAAEAKQLDQRCRKVIEAFPPEIYARALQFLYTKETKSSYAIERETPDVKRAQKFVEALKEASQRDYLLKETLAALQQAVVDPRFANTGWRDTIAEQNYVGRSVGLTEEEVHFVAPKPEDLAGLMNAYLDAARRILNSKTHPVVAAAIITYPFVFLQPRRAGGGVARCPVAALVWVRQLARAEVNCVRAEFIAGSPAEQPNFAVPSLPKTETKQLRNRPRNAEAQRPRRTAEGNRPQPPRRSGGAARTEKLCASLRSPRRCPARRDSVPVQPNSSG